MKAIHFSETSVHLRTTQLNIPEDGNIQSSLFVFNLTILHEYIVTIVLFVFNLLQIQCLFQLIKITSNDILLLYSFQETFFLCCSRTYLIPLFFRLMVSHTKL
jgi:hypothetical protein